MASRQPVAYPQVSLQDDTVIYTPVAGLTYAIRDDGYEIRHAAPDVPARLDFALQNGALYGYQQHLRRRLALHASGFVHGGRAYGIAGFSGWGKSTTAAHVRALGPGFLTDDILAIRDDPAGPVALAGPPKARLWPDAAAKMGFDVDQLVTVYDEIDKRFVDIEPVVPEAPLGGLYILDRSAKEVGLTTLGGLDAVMELVLHTYSIRIIEQRHEPWHLSLCSAVAAAVPVKRLGIPKGLDYVDVAARLVMDDLESMGAGGS